jgi:DNA-directed RNA polymerase subunit H (RpoH/RPB5)|tara:strand:+ start:196 stop:450 length:255 start_codon:yes stop_codon:yes gene_type:complete
MDPLGHSRVPDHIILNKTQSKAALKQLNIAFEQLPGLWISDPALVNAANRQGIDFVPEDAVIKIIRNSPLGDAESVYYRRPILV